VLLSPGQQLLLGIISAPGPQVAVPVAATFLHAFVPYLSHLVRNFPVSSIHHEDEGTYLHDLTGF